MIFLKSNIIITECLVLLFSIEWSHTTTKQIMMSHISSWKCWEIPAPACWRHPKVVCNWLDFFVFYFSVFWDLLQLGNWYIPSSGGQYIKERVRDINLILLMVSTLKGKFNAWGWMPFRIKTTFSLLLWDILNIQLY